LETLQSLGRMICGYDPKLMSFQILPFHQLGKDKWKQAGLKYAFEEIPEAKATDVNRAIDIIKSAMIETKEVL
jgi:pyruvate-formate lyase-activating enzyme